MKDFFSVMGKAFAIVFGSTSALALVLVLLAFAMRPVLKSWSQQEVPASTQIEKSPDTPPAGYYEVPAPCKTWDEKGRCIEDKWVKHIELSLRGCTKDGCVVYSGNTVVGSVSRNEITKAQWTPVQSK
jgi:hypothetical protein